MGMRSRKSKTSKFVSRKKTILHIALGYCGMGFSADTQFDGFLGGFIQVVSSKC